MAAASLAKFFWLIKFFMIFLLSSVAVPAFQELPSFSTTSEGDFEIGRIPEEAATL